MVGNIRTAPKTFLKRFKAIGCTISPLFLNKITADAQIRAVLRARISPMCGTEDRVRIDGS